MIDKTSQLPGWIGLIIGVLASMGALMWLLVSSLAEPPLLIFAPGLIQLGIALFLIVAKWVIPNSRQTIILVAAIVCLIINAIFGLCVMIVSLPTLNQVNRPTNVLTVNDPDSPLVVTVEEDSRGALPDERHWSATISADGKRPTQYTGWPVDLIGRKASPTELIWHNDDPDWVEIRLDDGVILKLSWDSQAATAARLASELHYFLDPKFELIR